MREVAVRAEGTADREAHALALAGLTNDVGGDQPRVLDRELQQVEAKFLRSGDQPELRITEGRRPDPRRRPNSIHLSSVPNCEGGAYTD